MPLNDPITPALLADPEIFQQNRLPFHAHFGGRGTVSSILFLSAARVINIWLPNTFNSRFRLPVIL